MRPPPWTSAVDESFRARASAWLAAHAVRVEDADDVNMLRYDADLEGSRQVQRALAAAGLAGLTWPQEYGGQGLGTEEQLVWAELVADYVVPTAVFGIAHGMVGPTLLELGTPEQKQRYLPPMLTGDEIWCQLFSEPSGGSDVASLRTRATRTAGGWVLDGQKVWTSGAHHSDFGVVLARTDPTVPKHRGITMFIVDMRHPGVTVRPLRIATGDSPFNEVFLDGVEVDDDAVVGEVDAGWAAAVLMLSSERIMLGAGGRSRHNPLGFDALDAAIARSADPSTRERAADDLAELWARETALEQFGRLMHEEALAGVPIGARGSVGKLAGSELMIRAAETAEELLGEPFAVDPDLAVLRHAAVYAPGHAVAGGSAEIQRNIIGERVLGLPKDGGIDRNVPFDQLRLGPAVRSGT